MNSFINDIKLINRGVLVLSSVLFFPVLPLGVVLGFIWLWLITSVANKKTSFYFTGGYMVVMVLVLIYGYEGFIPYAKAFWSMFLTGLRNNDWLFPFTVWFNSWSEFKYTLVDLNLYFIVPIQGLALANFFILRSPELMHQVVKRSKGIDSNDYKKADRYADKFADYSVPNGSLIGVEMGSNKVAAIPDTELNNHLFVGGATGSGKTVTLKNFIISAIERGIPLIYVDGKADQKLPLEIKAMCDKYGRSFKLFEMSATAQVKYNPLSVGGFTELKDKIVTMKTVDSSAGKFYQTAEGEYLQFLFKVLQKSGKHIDLYTLGSYITMPKLFDLISSLNDVGLQNEARELKDRLSDSLDGLISDINTFIKSELGHLFECNDGDVIVDLDKDIKAGSVVYFSLNDLNYPDYAARMGKLIINDLKSVYGRVSEDAPLKTFGIFDEFTTYAGEQFTTILARTRSKGMHAIVGSQSFDTIDKISPKLASDLIANCNTFIIHRQNSDVDAEKLADVIGKTNTMEMTYHNSSTVNSSTNSESIGSSHSYRMVRENKVDPEKIQALQDGYAYVLRKKIGSQVRLVKIRFIKT